MTGWSALERFLRTEPSDAGCAEDLEGLLAAISGESAG